MQLDIHYQDRAQENTQQCLSQLKQCINEHTYYTWLERVMHLCFGLATLAMTGCATLFLMQWVFGMSGLGLAMLVAVGAMVVLGGLGVLAMWGMNRVALGAAADLLRVQTNQSQRSATLNQNSAPHVIQMTPTQQMHHENIQEYQMH